MSRKFRSQNNFIKYIIFVVFIIFGIYMFFKLINNNLFKFKLYKSSNDYINHLLLNNNLTINFNDIISSTINLDMKKPISYLKNTINFNNYYMDNIKSYIYNFKNPINPIIYLYSSNYTKQLSTDNEFNIPSNILILYILKGMLDNKHLDTYILLDDLETLGELNNTNMYETSRIYLKENLAKYNLKLILDIEIGTNDDVIINNKKYAKMEIVTRENNIFNELDKNLITIVNDNNLYNGDLTDKLVLIRIGSSSSDLDSIYNSLLVLSDSIKNLIGDKNG